MLLSTAEVEAANVSCVRTDNCFNMASLVAAKPLNTLSCVDCSAEGREQAGCGSGRVFVSVADCAGSAMAADPSCSTSAVEAVAFFVSPSALTGK